MKSQPNFSDLHDDNGDPSRTKAPVFWGLNCVDDVFCEAEEGREGLRRFYNHVDPYYPDPKTDLAWRNILGALWRGDFQAARKRADHWIAGLRRLEPLALDRKD